ncbi:MAG: N-acetyl-gamma-glutamyl-phosphate reductase [Deltaproteobacteria bacterium]|nr:N-acetyl-gamma-glutamyl-phosphate reductase [Deltaproteobacteria bacterium]
MLKVAIVGASGYTGVELIRLLSNHPEIEITAVTSEQSAGKRIAEVFTSLSGVFEKTLEHISIEGIAQKADLIFTALPHQKAMDVVPHFLKAGKRVIDLSADFRIKDAATYGAWYEEHKAPGLLKEAVYGLPELHRTEIKNARLVANPGCYPTSAILALAPLLKNGLIDVSSIVIDSKSGVSGAGRSATQDTHFTEVNEGFKAYKVGEHRHTPEIEQELSLLAGSQITVSFTPHLLPVNRGILSTIYASVKADVTEDSILRIFDEFYSEERFVRVYPKGSFPNINNVKGSNFCDIGIKLDKRTNRVVIISAIDNLTKGAAGQAVQNMNIMHGFPEDTALRGLPLFP